MEPTKHIYHPFDAGFVDTLRALEESILQRSFKRSRRGDAKKLTQEQLCRLFPALREESERRSFEERYKDSVDVSNHTYRLRNPLLPVSVPRHLTPESVCLLQSSQVAYEKLRQAGIEKITNFATTQGTSGRGRGVACSVPAAEGEPDVHRGVHPQADRGRARADSARHGGGRVAGALLVPVGAAARRV